MRKEHIKAFELLEKVRRAKPVVHHLTNWVTVYDCANIVKVLGASPIMAHAPEEVGQMAGIADALVLNIGTLTVDLVKAMKLAAKAANKKGIPVVLDVCGAGATDLRDESSFALLNECRIDVVKGNASEVARIAGENVQTKGVDASRVEADLKKLAERLACERNCAVVITGKEDIVIDASGSFAVRDLGLPSGVDAERFSRRQRMRAVVDEHFSSLEKSAVLDGMDTFYQRAYSLISSDKARAAFAINDEPAALRDSYGRNEAGQRMLLARRLVEAGVRFVSLSYGGWDHHDNIKNGMAGSLPQFDQAFAALINDLVTRGLLQSTLVMVTTEFGRTPKINATGGRDHRYTTLVVGAGCYGPLRS